MAVRLPTLNKILKPNYRAPPSLPIDLEESLLPPVKSSSTFTKKPHYIIVLTKEAKPKKNINGNIGEQNIVLRKRIKKTIKNLYRLYS